MAKNFIDNLSEETRKGMIEKASQGIWPSYSPIGYLNADGANGKRTIIPDPALAPLVRRLYATGQHSVKELAAAIAPSEHLTRGCPIQKSTANKILRNRVYSGELNGGAKRTRLPTNRLFRVIFGSRHRRWIAASGRVRRRPATASRFREC